MASMVWAEIPGFSAIWLRKSPGASCKRRNVISEMPNSRGMVCSTRRST
jgi:hypothetical protein